MSTLIIPDLDGVILYSKKRGDAAEEETQQRLAAIADRVSEKKREELYKEIFYHPQNFYHPDRMAGDTLIEGAALAVDRLEKRGRVVYLTSRPAFTREVTERVLHRYHLLKGKRDVYMKPDGWKYQATIGFKAGMVEFLQQAFQPDLIILIDDEEAIRNAVKELTLPSCTIRVYASLTNACKEL